MHNRNKKLKETVLTKKGEEFVETKKNELNYIHISTLQTTSIGVGLIPFLEHNDANRALMGSNMQKQAIPLTLKETAIVQTGLEKEIVKKSGSILISNHSCYIKNTRLNVTHFIRNKGELNVTYKNNSKLEKCIKNINHIKIKSKKMQYKKKIYLKEIKRKSNQNSTSKSKTLFKKNEWIKKGEIIVDNTETQNGKICIGKNLLVAYMTWNGYNFEDAICINKNLIDAEILTSLSSKIYKTFIIKNEDEEVRKEKWLKF